MFVFVKLLEKLAAISLVTDLLPAAIFFPAA
jgi:hypothetical protein